MVCEFRWLICATREETEAYRLGQTASQGLHPGGGAQSLGWFAGTLGPCGGRKPKRAEERRRWPAGGAAANGGALQVRAVMAQEVRTSQLPSCSGQTPTPATPSVLSRTDFQRSGCI